VLFRTVARIDLVAAHLALGDLDAAHTHSQPLFTLPAECRTKPVTGRIAKVTALLADPRFATAPLANELREQIDLFRTYSAARDLPEMPT
jgi:hypothetical protein